MEIHDQIDPGILRPGAGIPASVVCDEDVVDDPKEWIDRVFVWTPATLRQLITGILNAHVQDFVTNHVDVSWYRGGVIARYHYWRAGRASYPSTDRDREKHFMEKLEQAKKVLRQRGLGITTEYRIEPWMYGTERMGQEEHYAVRMFGSNCVRGRAEIAKKNKLIFENKLLEEEVRVISSRLH